jgi:uncharacterized membrane protein
VRRINRPVDPCGGRCGGRTCRARCRGTVWLDASPGDCVAKGDVLAVFRATSGDPVKLADTINDAYVLGSERSIDKDAGFAVQQLVEIALRALSPGVNEPFTAIAAIDWLGGSLALLAQRRMPDATRTNNSAAVRIVIVPRTFVTLLREAFEPIALHAGPHPDVVNRLLDALVRLAQVANRVEDRQAIADVGRMVSTIGFRDIQDEPQRARIAERSSRVQRTLDLQSD